MLQVDGYNPFPYEFDTPPGGQAIFPVGIPFDAGNHIDVFINNRGPHREGASHDFVRNVGSQQIEMNYTVPEDNWVKIIIYA